MTATPSILQSASNLFQAGNQQLDKAAAEVAEGTQQLDGAAQNPSNNSPPDSPIDQDQTSTPLSPTSPQPDTLTQGLLDTIRARMQISTAAVLVHAYNHTTDDLLHMLDPNHHPRD